jgi:hypothetical protein
MKLRIIFTMTTMVVTCPLAFWLYGEGRTMCETFGLDTRSITGGLLAGALFPALIIIPSLVVMCRWPSVLNSGTLLHLTLNAAIGLMAGSVLSECWILADEVRFASEVVAGAPMAPYSRPRAWPNEGTALVYIPGRGIHATD